MSKIWKKGIASLLGMLLILSTMPLASAESSPKLLPLNTTVTGELSQIQTEETYTFTLPQTGKLTLSIDSAVQDELYVNLKDSNEQSIFLDMENRIETERKKKEITLHLEAGTYYLKVNVYDKAWNTVWKKFTITTEYTPVATDDAEPNNDTLTAQELMIGKSTKGFFSRQDSKDVHELRLNEPGRLHISFLSEMDDINIRLMDSNETIAFEHQVTAFKGQIGKKDVEIDLEPGTYFLYIEQGMFWDDTGVYQLETTFNPAHNQEAEPNNSPSQSVKFPFYTKQKGFLSWNDPIDLYRFDIPKSSQVTIDLTTSIAEQVRVRVYSADGELYLSQPVYGSVKDPHQFLKTLLLPKGTYYFQIEDYFGNDDTGVYDLIIKSNHLLPVLSINKVTTRSTKVSGKTEKGATVTMMLGKKSYKRKADSKGNYSFAINKQKAGTSIKISTKNKYGSTVKTVKVSR
ncbi:MULTISPECIES: Ig-like domain-containing protein [unclassified Exiguobacterium]|uniref:Bacterial Ig domain-containing protein n=1 Tax=Exiguobacterium sp. (strain ATCC BAA-1283 / AT1b) TaxID=360911 RepID=C4L6T4_EXISA|nr:MULTISPECIES: Ig-like domain-containing protein [unclassified Exiguobacterium]ACQ70027.1 hypothetical protein EAT1b_1099 [Exiguobacterium sp. AT1b]